MSRYLSESEAKERCEDRLRRHGATKEEAKKTADPVVGKVMDNYAAKTNEKRR